MVADPNPWYAQGRFYQKPPVPNATTVRRVTSNDDTVTVVPPSGVGDVDLSIAGSPAIAGVLQLTSVDNSVTISPGTGIGVVDVSVPLDTVEVIKLTSLDGSVTLNPVGGQGEA